MGRAIVRDPQRVPDGRAAVEPRRQAARADAHRGLAHPAAAGDDDGLRDPRPDRGDDARRPRRGHARGRAAAGRHAQGALRATRQPLRRRLHRLAVDELLHRRRSTATRSSCRSARSRSPTRRKRAAARRRRSGRGHRRPAARALRGRRARAASTGARHDVRGRRSTCSSRWAPRSTPTSATRATTSSHEELAELAADSGAGRRALTPARPRRRAAGRRDRGQARAQSASSGWTAAACSIFDASRQELGRDERPASAPVERFGALLCSARSLARTSSLHSCVRSSR